jgi:L-cysteine/cystine lyase
VTFDEARAQFPVLERVAYLNAGTFGPLAQATVDAISEQLRQDLEQGRSGKAYIEEMQAARATLPGLIASLLAATPEHVSLTYSTTDACNIVLAGLGLRPDDEIVTTDAEHFGLAGPVFTSGATVRVARVQELGPEEALEAIVAEITPRARLLAVSHVLWTTGVVLDVHALKERSGLPVLVDGAQSVGAIPVDVGALDYYTVSGQKWLCGPDTTGALYVADVESLRVARPGMFAQESFEPGGRYVPRQGAQRFDSGWLSIASLKALATAIGLAPEWRFARIEETAAHCRDALAARAQVVTPPQQAGLVTFRPEDDPEALTARLLERGVVVRHLPGTPWLRASCGWWTNEDDVERLASGLP